MLISNNRLKNAPILSLQTGAVLGQVGEPIIDPRELHVVAFYCAGPRVRGTAVLHTSDIREVSNMGLIVDNADVLMPPDDLVRLKEVTGFNFKLLEKQVVDTRKRRLGRVDGFSLDVDSFYIMKLNVRQPLIRSFLSSNLLVDRTQITEVSNARIIVQANEAKEKSTLGGGSPILENPFRRHTSPQPNGSQTQVSRE